MIDDPNIRRLNIGDREVLIFWDYPCLYQKSDATTQGVTLLQLDSFERGLGSINVLYGHVGTLCLLCTVSYPVVTRTGYKDSAWPYFESLVSTMIKDQDRAVDLPTALSWVRRVGNNKIRRDATGAFTGCSNTCGGRRGSCRWIRTRSMARLWPNTPRTAAT